METQIAAALALILPYVLRAGKRAAEEASDVLGTDAGRMASALWEQSKGAILGNPIAKSAAEDVAADNQDEDSIAALRRQLRKLLAEDPSLREELAAILASGGGTATNATFVTNLSGGQKASKGGTIIAGPNLGQVTSTVTNPQKK
jgi:hypothetical protein